MNLYDQLRTLQVMDNAFTEWTDYRKDLTDYIITHTLSNQSLAIWGAGRCNDLDLERLSSHFQSITLLDQDENAMQAAIYRYNLGDSKNIHTRVIDFVGITDEDYRQYAAYLVDEVRKKGIHIKYNCLVEVVLEVLEHLYQKIIYHAIPIEKNSFDYAIVIGVHSQLISMLEWIWSIILQTIQQEEYEVRHAIGMMNDGVVEKFNQTVLNTTRKNVIMGYELGRLDRAGVVQGAHQAMEDIKKRACKEEIEITNTVILEWPFNLKEGIAYKVKLQKIYPFCYTKSRNP